jgi:hypothetical protein
MRIEIYSGNQMIYDKLLNPFKKIQRCNYCKVYHPDFQTNKCGICKNNICNECVNDHLTSHVLIEESNPYLYKYLCKDVIGIINEYI